MNSHEENLAKLDEGYVRFRKHNLKNLTEPSSIEDISAFIGLTSPFRQAIKYFSIISGPLNKHIIKYLGYKTGKLPCTTKKYFLALKQTLLLKPCLQAVDFNTQFYVTSYASAARYCSCLSQIGADDIERPCSYASKLLNEKEANQTPGIRERGALLYALHHKIPAGRQEGRLFYSLLEC